MAMGAPSSCSTWQKRVSRARGQPTSPAPRDQRAAPARRKLRDHHTECNYPPKFELPDQKKDLRSPGTPSGGPHKVGVWLGKDMQGPTYMDILDINLLHSCFCACLRSVVGRCEGDKWKMLFTSHLKYMIKGKCTTAVRSVLCWVILHTALPRDPLVSSLARAGRPPSASRRLSWLSWLPPLFPPVVQSPSSCQAGQGDHAVWWTC